MQERTDNGRQQGPVASTTHGLVRGTVKDGVLAFLGIPFAAPPIGERRFRPPVPPERWDGVRDVVEFGPAVPQVRPGGFIEEFFSPVVPAGDDCLRLNVWTPDLGGVGLPVLVWVHGGGFEIGSGADSLYDGATFARDGVVCVTVNYRVGAAGFLHVTDDGGGDCGLLDQLAALEWVQENIAAFGGDPGLVTLAGESAGAMSTAMLMGSPAAKGLFRRAISESGACHHGLSVETSREIARRFAAEAGIAFGDLEALQQLSTEAVLDVQRRVSALLSDEAVQAEIGPDLAFTGLPFQPLIGGRVVPTHPLQAVREGAGKDVELLLGHTAEESLLGYGMEPIASSITMEIARARFDAVFGDASTEAFETYAKARPTASPAQLAAALETDRLVRVPAVRMADAHSAHQRTYFYRFSWRSNAFDGGIGAAHTLELPFVWDKLDDRIGVGLTGGDAPRELATEMHGAWVRFVTDGTPAPAEAWPAYDAATRGVKDFDSTSRVLWDPDPDELRLWDSVI